MQAQSGEAGGQPAAVIATPPILCMHDQTSPVLRARSIHAYDHNVNVNMPKMS